MSLETLAQWSQIAGAVVFVIAIVLIWNKYIAPGVKAYQASKNAELADAEARREHIRADVAAARGEVERADEDCREIASRVGLVAKREREKSLAEAHAEADRIVRNAEGELERARFAARDRLRIEFIEKALAAARAAAAGRVSEDANRALVAGTVDDLVRGRG
jgi:F0F1-type ATP synthase membrane subunit b/b'